jgi:DNA-binding SARP family transcriptional activator/TolB-like protein/Flp pilus assembly protein TadD
MAANFNGLDDNSGRNPVRGVEIRTLGNLELVDRETGSLIAVPSKKARALLIALSAAPRLTVTRARLAALLWGSSTEEQARQSLRQLLSNFRRIATDHTLFVTASDEDAIRLNPDVVQLDRSALIALTANADIPELTRAAELYRGEFATGAEIGEPDFDEWLQVERERVREAAISMFDRLVRELARHGRHEEALSRATALLAIDPMREETHRLVIAQEAIVSGRASAMKRYEGFRLLLRDELGVRPEPATLQLLDKLRELPSAKPRDGETIDIPAFRAPPASTVPPTPATAGAEAPTPKRSAVKARSLAIAVALVVLAGGWSIFQRGWTTHGASSYVGEDGGRLSVAVLPFETSTTRGDLKAAAVALESETVLAFSRSNRLSIIDFPEHEASRSPTVLGKTLHVRYIVKTAISEVSGSAQANVTLFDSSTGVSVWSASLNIDDGSRQKFAREFYRYIFAEIALHRSQALVAIDKDSTEALLWRAEAAQLHNRVGAAEPVAAELYERILSRDPKQLFALLGLSDYFILKVARDQSSSREADIKRADELLTQARALAPNLSDVAFKQGMLNKLQGRFEQASLEFERTFRLDPTHWNAAAQYAHVNIFLGHFETAYDSMAIATKNLLPDIAAAETAYIAGETALVAGHPAEAVTYLEMAINGNATVGRIHALYAAALQTAGREAEARMAAAEARRLSPGYTPEVMARRGGRNPDPRYIVARDNYVEAFRTALKDHPT